MNNLDLFSSVALNRLGVHETGRLHIGGTLGAYTPAWTLGVGKGLETDRYRKRIRPVDLVF
jgi:hypothetical protein